ncbi:MAG: TIGR04255 family protein [Gammaproteobacteria bacterium]|jgi:uncharacterized protein (TIGR04255 family)
MEYKRNFITSVILKIDFSKIDKFDAAEFPIRELVKKYPEKKIQPRTEFLTQLSKDKQSIEQRTFNECRYYSEDMKNCFSISESSCFFELKDHIGFTTLKGQFECICEILKNKFNIETVNRIGLRYINNVSGDISADWRKYIVTELSSMSEFYRNINKGNFKKVLSLSRISLKNQDTIINFIVGNPNKNYPAAIMKDELLLDYDSFCSNVDIDAIIPKLEMLHQNILSLFEKSITKEFRDLMNN